MTSSKAQWEAQREAYAEHLSRNDNDSTQLRNELLIPGLKKLIGQPGDHRQVLDAGCGTGWLLDRFKLSGRMCDSQIMGSVTDKDPRFDKMDLRALFYGSRQFSLVVCSLVTMYLSDRALELALIEFDRILEPNGQLILAIMHPFSYRTGQAIDDGQFIVSEKVHEPFQFEFRVNDTVGPFTYYHRPLSSYINTLADRGWHVNRILELGPKDLSVSPKGRVRSPLVPMFALIRAQKGLL